MSKRLPFARERMWITDGGLLGKSSSGGAAGEDANRVDGWADTNGRYAFSEPRSARTCAGPRIHGQRPSSSTSSDQLKKVRTATITARTPTL